MATDFAVFLRRFLTGHLAGLRGRASAASTARSAHDSRGAPT